MSSAAVRAEGGHIPAHRNGARAPSAARMASTSIGWLGAQSCAAGSTDTISSVASVVNGPHSLWCSTRPSFTRTPSRLNYRQKPSQCKPDLLRGGKDAASKAADDLGL